MKAMIHIVNGDLLQAQEDIIGHQVNCQGVMGSGVAKALRASYASLYPEYKKYCDLHSSPDQLLGHCLIVSTKDKQVANLFGQLQYGRQKVLYTNYEALKKALATLKQHAAEHNQSVALPHNIGCGLANGDWSIVSQMIEEVFHDYDVTLYKL